MSRPSLNSAKQLETQSGGDMRDLDAESHTPHGPQRSQERELPVEVWERIIDILAAENKREDDYNWTAHPGWATLVACTLVCKAWYHRSWYHLHWQISLRKREQVVALARLLRAEPKLRAGVKRISIAGGLNRDQHRLPIPHLATFAAMLACKLPGVRELVIRHAEWGITDTRHQTVSNLYTFRSVQILKLINVTFASPMLFGRLLAALPSLTWMHCSVVRCLKDEPQSLPPLPRTTRELAAVTLCEPIDPAILALLVRYSEEDACVLQFLCLEMDIPSQFTLASKKGQQLLDSSRAHLRFFVLKMYMDDISPDVQKAALEPHIDLARALKMERLTIDCSCVHNPDFSWLSKIISTIESDAMHEVDIVFTFHKKDHDIHRLEALLERFEQHGDLTAVDEVLAHPRFMHIKQRGVGLFIDLASGLELRSLGRDAVERVEQRWQEIVMRKMTQLLERGMLRAFVWA